MDAKFKITDSCGSAMPVSGKVEKQEQPVAEEKAPAIESVTGNAGQLVPPKHLCPEVPLDGRRVDVADEGKGSKSANGETSLSIMEDEEIKKSIELAIDILGHPKRTKGFRYGNRSLGKKASGVRLSQALEKFEGQITPENRHNLNPIKNLIEQALEDVNKKRHRAIAAKVAKIGVPLVAGVASVAATVATLGASGPITIPAAIAAGAAIIGAVTDSGKSVAEAVAEE